MKRTFSVLMSMALAGSMLAITADESFARSRVSQCKAYARHEAQRSMDNSVGTGAAVGAGLGGLYGGLTGGGAGSNIITGVIAGGVGGAVLGGMSHHDRSYRVYRRAFEDCMNNY